MKHNRPKLLLTYWEG